MTTRITFVGDPRVSGQDRSEVEFGAVLFPLGVAVEVSDEALAAKLARHSHFYTEIEAANPAPVDPVPPDAFVPPETPLTPVKRGPGRPRKNL